MGNAAGEHTIVLTYGAPIGKLYQLQYMLEAPHDIGTFCTLNWISCWFTAYVTVLWGFWFRTLRIRDSNAWWLLQRLCTHWQVELLWMRHYPQINWGLEPPVCCLVKAGMHCWGLQPLDLVCVVSPPAYFVDVNAGVIQVTSTLNQ